jgi:hypothetical protein
MPSILSWWSQFSPLGTSSDENVKIPCEAGGITHVDPRDQFGMASCSAFG